MKIANVVKDRLATLASAHGGRLTPDAVVADARKRDSPLHHLFEWDLKKAAQKQWLDTARQLIRSVEVVVTVENIGVKTPFYVRDPNQDTGAQGYIAVSELRNDQDAAREALVNEFQKAADMLRRARHIAIALSLSSEVEEIIFSIVDLRDRVRHAEPPATM